MSSTTINDVPVVCLAEIATYLDDDSLMNMILTNKGLSICIHGQKNHIQEQRFFNTFSANPYKHHKFKDCPKKLNCVPSFTLLDEVASICDTEKVVIEELVTQYVCPYTAFQWHLENGTNNMYITNLLVKADFNNNGHIWICYGTNALRVEFGSQMCMSMSKDCYIIPVNDNYKLENLRIDVYLKENINVIINVFNFNNYEYIYFDD